MNKKTLIFICIASVLIFTAFSIWYLLDTNKIEKTDISRPKNQPDNNILPPQIGGDENKTLAAKTQIESLILSLQEEVLKIEPGDTSSIVAALKKYKTEFNNYTLTINQLNLGVVDKNSFKSIRLAEWGNYKLYLAAKQRFATNTVASQTLTETQKLLDNYIKDQSKKSLDQIVVKASKKSGTLFPRFLSRIGEIMVDTVEAESSRNVIHKKVILDPDDPGRNGRLLLCWSYESWVELETGNIKQEQSVTFGTKGDYNYKCQTEVDIADGATGSKIGLNPVDKLAEWIIPPKRGIGSEAKKDPYSEFKEKLEQGVYVLLGTDIFNGKEIYILKEPGYQLAYEIISLDAVNYLPVRKLGYAEDIIVIGPTPDAADPTKSTIIRTGKVINELGFRYIVGEVIERESLPLDFFEPKIPDGYELKEWVPHG
jgi:hypothetical protein